MLFGLALIPILLGVGVAVDYGRALIVRERMADAADAAALAIGSWTGLTEPELKTKAQQFFDANYPPTQIGTVGTLNVNFVGDDIMVDVSGVVPTTFMKLANIDTMDVGASTVVRKKERNIEVVLVLDITGSMNSGGKLTAMKNAAKKLVDILFEGKGVSDTLKIGLVPFSAAVNVGSDKQNSGWLDTATYPNNSAIAKEDFGFTNGQSAWTLYSQLRNRSWTGCVRERGGSAELSDDPPTSTATRWAPYFAPDEPDNDSSYVNDYLSDGSYSNANCPGGTSNAEKRQCYTGKYNNANASPSSRGPHYLCPPSPITPMTNVKSTVTNAINALVANGNTVIPAGLLWGWRVISPTEPYTEGRPYDDEKWVKAIVLLTDGENDISEGGNGHNRSVYNAFGYAKSGHLGSTNGSNAEATLNTKTATVCGLVKAKEILVYTIGFQVSGSTINNLLRNCATQPDMYYNSPTNEQLAAVFQDIAQGLSELRIAQ
jgi:Flp pilus assembly protein TadG